MDGGNPKYFDALPAGLKARALQSKLPVYECEGTESEIKAWFQTINIAGVPLNDQELLNAVYSGPFVTRAKAEFSNSGNAKVQKWSAYVKGSANRQDFLERALDWTSGGEIGEYMGRHRHDASIDGLKTTFDTVIDWVSGVFTDVEKEMSGLEWGRLYEEYHGKAYDPARLSAEVQRLYADPYVKKRGGMFEYLLGGSQATRLLEVRVFDDATKRAVYERQTREAEAAGESNCPLCALGHDANKGRIWKLAEMDADHVAAWSKGGGTAIENCQMLCTTHNRAKGNR